MDPVAQAQWIRDMAPRRLAGAPQQQWIEALDAGSGDSDFRLRCQGASHDWAGTTWQKASDALIAGCAVCWEIKQGAWRLALEPGQAGAK